MKHKWVSFPLGFVFGISVFALPPKIPSPVHFKIQIENDLLIGPYNEDRDYTMGIKLISKGDWISRYSMDNPLKWVDSWWNWLIPYPQWNQNSMNLISETYTPNNLPESQAIHDDRPYASLFLIQWEKTELLSQTFYLSSSLSFGALGLPISKEFQRIVHTSARWSRKNSGLYNSVDHPKDPKGWKNQISNGGEPTGIYSIEMRKKTPTSLFVNHLFSKVSLGYQTKLDFGFTLQSSPFIQTNKSHCRITSTWLITKPFYNALLQGQFRASPVTFSSNKLHSLIYNGQLGVEINHQKYLLQFSLNGKSPEIIEQSRYHYWGSLSVGYSP
jgi:hypothetical protein